MPTIVELPDNIELEFPDGMDDSAIQSEVAKAFPKFTIPAPVKNDKPLMIRSPLPTLSEGGLQMLREGEESLSKPLIGPESILLQPPLPALLPEGVVKETLVEAGKPLREVASGSTSLLGAATVAAAAAMPEVVVPLLGAAAIPMTVEGVKETANAKTIPELAGGISRTLVGAGGVLAAAAALLPKASAALSKTVASDKPVELSTIKENKPPTIAPGEAQKFIIKHDETRPFQEPDIVRSVRTGEQTVYHATPAQFENFDTSFENSLGTHFGTERQASYVAKEHPNSRIIAANITLNNPVRFTTDPIFTDAPSLLKQLEKMGVISPEESTKLNERINAVNKEKETAAFDDDPKLVKAQRQAISEIKNLLKSKGYDGLVYPNAFERKTGEPIDFSYAVFEPKQIKQVKSPATSLRETPARQAPMTGTVSSAEPPAAAPTGVPPAIREATTVGEKAQVAVPPAEESAQGAVSTIGPSLQPLPSPQPVPSVKGLREISADLAKGLGVPIRYGRLTTSKFAGYFKQVQNLIGSKAAQDMPVVSHEVGHRLDTTFGLSRDPVIANELMVLGDPASPGSRSSWTPSKSQAYRLGEGTAEFVRLWLTDPAALSTTYPNTFAAFERALNSNADWADVMRTAQNDIHAWRAAPDQMRLRSHISVGENPNGTPYRVPQLTRDLIDDLHFSRLAVDDAQRLSGRNLKPTENIYILGRLLRGAYGRADALIRNGMVDFKTKAVSLGTSLEDALRPVSGRINDFRDWIVAKRAQELHGQGRNTGLVQSDIDSVATRFNNDAAFQDAFSRIKEWQEGVLQYAVDAGLISDSAKVAMREMNQDYVPIHRVFEIGAGEAPSQQAQGIGRGLNVGKPGSLKKLKGSARAIVDPLETMVKNAYVMTLAAEKSYLQRQLAKMADMPGMGKWVERIKTPQTMERVGIEKIRKQLEDAGADLTNVPDDLLVTFFQNAGQSPFGENIIRTVSNGKPEFYRLDSDLYNTFHALDSEDAGTIVRLLSAPANLLRSGVTLAPDFALANAVRDAFSSSIVSKYGMLPFEATIRGVAAMISDPKLVAEWKAAGGRHAVEASYFDRVKLQRFLKEHVTKDLTPTERALIWTKSPLMALRWISSAAEEATRIGEYQVSLNKNLLSGMTEGDARTLASFESRDRQDFAKGGAKTKSLRMLTPFWNAALQGNMKLAQAFKERPGMTTLKGLAFITTAKMLEQAVNYDNPDYWDRPQWERDLFFLFPIGKDANGHSKFLRIPTPFEVGIIFGTLPGRLVQLSKEKNPSAFRDFATTVLNQTVPNPVPNTLQAVYETFMTGKQGWDVYRNKPIVNDRVADLAPGSQWTKQTSLTARKIGKMLNFPPMKIDHLIARTTGGLGRQLTHNVSDRIISKVTGEERTAKGTAPGGRFITTPAGVQSQAVETFYQNLSKVRGDRQSAKLGETSRFDSKLVEAFEKTAEALIRLRKASRMATTERESQAFELQMAELARNMNETAKEYGLH